MALTIHLNETQTRTLTIAWDQYFGARPHLIQFEFPEAGWAKGDLDRLDLTQIQSFTLLRALIWAIPSQDDSVHPDYSFLYLADLLAHSIEQNEDNSIHSWVL